jgi:chromosome segregation ATPase
MTKLEQKLIELGYENTYRDTRYIKQKISHFRTIISLEEDKQKIEESFIEYDYVETQQDIDNLQQAFNQLQNDLKELKEW